MVNESELWHLRFGHLNFDSLKLLKNREMVIGLPPITNEMKICEGCIYGKMHRSPFPTSSWRVRAPLELVQLIYGVLPRIRLLAEKDTFC